MITVFLRGGLGNQMFQYAAGVSLAKKSNTRLVLDSTFLNDRFPRREFTYRTYDMDVFTVEPQFTTISKISTAFPVPGLWLGLDLSAMKISSTLGIQNMIIEDERPYAKMMVPAATKKDTILYGRWQSEKYFEDVKDEIRAAFQFRFPLNEEASRFALEIASSNSVALCVRRGDYVAFASAKKMMGDTNINYYSAAIRYMNEHVKDPRFVVFSDDLEWCKANLELPPGTLFSSNKGPKWSYHLELMSLCKHSIIANSTFYWWGAWLNRNLEKIVVAPKRWYADGPDDNNEIMPKGWITL